jgi:hypothetical protein
MSRSTFLRYLHACTSWSGARRARYVCFSKLFNFYFFLYISFLCVPEYLTTMYMLCTDVGRVHPTYFSRTRWCPLPEAGPTVVVEPVATAGGPPAKRLRDY